SRPYQYANSKTEEFRPRPFLSSNNADRSNGRGGRGLPHFVAKGGEPPIPLDSARRSDSTRRPLKILVLRPYSFSSVFVSCPPFPRRSQNVLALRLLRINAFPKGPDRLPPPEYDPPVMLRNTIA